MIVFYETLKTVRACRSTGVSLLRASIYRCKDGSSHNVRHGNNTGHSFLDGHLCLFLVLLSVKGNIPTLCELKLNVAINCIAEC